MSKLSSREAMRLCRDTSDIDVIVDLTHHPDPMVRQKALREMCPCRVKLDIDEFWRRVLAMRDDPAANVRQQVLHTLCDGSPPHLEYEIADALDEFNRDADPTIRRMAHKVLTSYRKKGKWNIL